MWLFHLGNVYQYFRESGMVDQGMVKNLDQILNPEKLATDAGVQVRSNILHLSLRTLIRLPSFQGKITYIIAEPSKIGHYYRKLKLSKNVRINRCVCLNENDFLKDSNGSLKVRSVLFDSLALCEFTKYDDYL